MTIRCSFIHTIIVSGDFRLQDRAVPANAVLISIFDLGDQMISDLKQRRCIISTTEKHYKKV